MYVYGPVPSRRLGKSLGVSPIPPKTCTYSCVYCQLGRTTHLRVDRESFFPKEAILAEITAGMRHSPTDFITFVGDGEPTLSSDIGWLIRQCKKRFPKPIAVITNGSLLFRPDVRNDLRDADVVLPSIDAGTDNLFRAVNRPHGHLDFQTVCKGLIEFRREYTGELWLEVMLIAGMNDSEESLDAIRALAESVMPDRVYLVTPTRPPAEKWVHPPTPEHLLRAQEILGQTEVLDQCEAGNVDLKAFSDTQSAIIEIGSRHPLRIRQAFEIERTFSEPGVVNMMIRKKQLLRVKYQGREYLLPAHFVRS